VDNAPIRDRIEELVDEEHRLRQAHAGRELDPEQRARLESVESELDRCWDVLRRRRAGSPERLEDTDVPSPPNELDGPEPEPPHLEHGVHGDGPAPDPEINPHAP
jgi:Protein of unknown function (DUF2630)